MPSIKTRLAYASIALNRAEDALSEAAAEVEQATADLQAIEAGTLDLQAVKVGGVRFIESGGQLVPEP